MISIQPLQHLHFNQWLALWQSYLKFYKTEMSRIQSITSWNRITNPAQQDLFGFGIFKEDQLVGFVHLVSHLSTWTSLPYCYLQDLYVDENYRQQGLSLNMSTPIAKKILTVCIGSPMKPIKLHSIYMIVLPVKQALYNTKKAYKYKI